MSRADCWSVVREDELDAAVVVAAAAEEVAVVLGVTTTTDELDEETAVLGVAIMTDVINVLVGWITVEEGSVKGKMENMVGTAGIERVVG
jgi:hypothetical protein